MRARPKTWKSKHDTKKNINFEIGNGLKKVDVLGVWNAGKGHNNTIKVNMKNATNPRKKWDSTVEQILNPLRPISQLTHCLRNNHHQLLGCLRWRHMKIDYNFHDVCYGDKWKDAELASINFNFHDVCYGDKWKCGEFNQSTSCIHCALFTTIFTRSARFHSPSPSTSSSSFSSSSPVNSCSSSPAPVNTIILQFFPLFVLIW